MRLSTTVMTLAIALFLGISNVAYAEKVAIIDAGSSGSRLYVYELDQQQVKLIFPLTQEQKKASRGRALSSIANHTDSVKVFLQQMTECYRGEDIPLYIMATAGMRLKPKAQADSIYTLLKQQPTLNGYTVKEAMTIPGQYEGLYGWLAANYANGKIALDATATQPVLTYTSTPSGIIEIGGASLQIAFQLTAPHAHSLSRPGLGDIYTISYLGAGVDQIYKHTPQGRRYKFNYEFDETVSKLYGKDTQFWGLSIPIANVLNGMDEQTHKRTFKGKLRAYIKSLKHFEDSPANYHPRMNSHYIKEVIYDLELDNRVDLAKEDSSWPLGAALDIAVYKISPEAFDHQHPN